MSISKKNAKIIHEGINKLKKVLEDLKSQISDLKLNTTYIQFDLEATRRELKMYKDIVEGNQEEN